MSTIPETRKTPFDHTYSYWPFDLPKLTLDDVVDCVKGDCWAMRFQSGRVVFNNYGLKPNTPAYEKENQKREAFIENPTCFFEDMEVGETLIVSMFACDGWDIHVLRLDGNWSWEIRCFRDENC
jgi:hypothetical protein